MSIRDVFVSKGDQVETISRLASAKAAADLMRRKKISALVVMKGNEIEGIVTEREIVDALSSDGSSFFARSVSDVMSKDTATIALQDDFKHAMRLMLNRRTCHLTVMDGHVLIGVVSIGDIVRRRLEELEAEANVLRDAYIAAH